MAEIHYNLFNLSETGCFPNFAKVKIKNGNSVRMSDLKIGERVQTGKNINKDWLINLCKSK